MKSLKRYSPLQISLIQALGLMIYITIVGAIIWNGERLFGPINNFLGPILFLSLFVASALICALITLAYPIWIFWEKKNTKDALKIVGFEAMWMIVFFFVVLLLIVSKV